jgi:hypothetical protein
MTGDGFLNIVAGASFADIGGVQDTGAIYVWLVNQYVEFSVPWADIQDWLGS